MNVFKEIYFNIIIIIIVLLGSVSRAKGSYVTPEDVSFATQRCQNISNARSDLKIRWTQWTFPDDSKTHCYVKCLLEKLGLIDLQTRGLDLNKFTIEIDDNELTNDDLDIYNILDEELSGTCKSYYSKWAYLIRNFPNSMKKFFYVGDKNVKEFYKSKPYGAKRKGMTANDFCISTLGSTNDVDTEFLQADSYCYWECLFKHFRYFDSYGRIVTNEVTSSFKEHKKSIKAEDVEHVTMCVHQGNQVYSLGACEMAKTLLKCLVTHIYYMNNVFAQRDIWTSTF